MRRTLVIGFATLCWFLMLPVSRAQTSPDPEGQPSMLREGAMASYWIWHDNDGYHLRTTTAHDRRAFSGRIDFSGGNGWAKAYQLRGNDEVKLTNDGIAFHLATERNLNGFDFRMDSGSRATLTLQLDNDKGEKILGNVFVGQNNAHPVSNPFSIDTLGGPGPAIAYPSTPPVSQPPTPYQPTGIAGQEPVSVDFASNPPGADILIDGYFKGNTPSTLQLAPGQHTIQLQLTGYRPYSVTMSVDPGSHPRIAPTLQPQ